MYLYVGLHIVSDALAGKKVLDTKVLGNAVPEHTTNFGWAALQQVRDLCLTFLLPIFSSFSNNAARHDLPNRQVINIESLSSDVSNSLGFAN